MSIQFVNVGEIAKRNSYIRNYTPCEIHGKTSAVASPRSEWTTIEWEYVPTMGDVIPVFARAYSGDIPDASFFFNLNKKTGYITDYKFTNLRPATDDDWKKMTAVVDNDQRRCCGWEYCRNLKDFFRDICDREYEKSIRRQQLLEEQARIARELASLPNVADQYQIIDKERAGTSYKEVPYVPTYLPDAEPTIPENTGKSVNNRQYGVQEWQRCGHYRYYKKTGKTIYIEASVMHRRKGVKTSK